MKKTGLYGVLVFLLLGAAVAYTGEQDYPKRLRRSESFLGIHFDFHAGKDCTEVGKNVDREMIEYIIDMVKPDYVQCDCKGHPGISSYPTKVGNPAPGFIRDPLKIWREVTAERGVALYMHYSGVWDNEAVKQHPEWARINEKDEIDKTLTSVFGPYVDELLIPQLKELSDVYGVDGVWVDGESWATRRDYGKNVIKAFQKQTGIQDIPRKSTDPHWYEFSEFCRDGFRNYVNHYVTEIHKYNPDFQIASNWAYSSMMPEPITIDVDFISGDFSAMNSLNTARLEGRCMSNQSKAWDLMSWSFTWGDAISRTQYSTKSVPQLCQEAAVVLSLGGGFQAYFNQNRDGSIRKWQMKLMSEVAKFCRKRQEICHKAEPVPQIGLIYSYNAIYHSIAKLLQPLREEIEPAKGILQSLLESQNVVDVFKEQNALKRMDEYPLLVFPEWEYIDPDFKQQLLTYVDNGGNLLIIGPKAAALFEDELGVTFTGEALESVNALEHNGWIAGVRSLYQKVELDDGVKPFGRIYQNNDLNTPYETAASIKNFGKGKIAAIYLNLGQRYYDSATSVSRDFLNSLVRELFPEPLVEVSGSHYVDVSVNRINGKLAVNLVNTSGPHSNDNVIVFDDIPSLGPLNVSIRSEEKPEKVILQPDGEELYYNYLNGKIVLTLPKLGIHDIIVVE